MKENWFVILLFSVIFGILGYLLGSQSSSDSCRGYSSKGCAVFEECSHHGNSGHHEIHVDVDHGHHEIHAIVESLGENFVGDTTIVIDGGEIRISKSEDGEMTVEVEMEEESDDGGSKKIRKEVTIKIDED